MALPCADRRLSIICWEKVSVKLRSTGFLCYKTANVELNLIPSLCAAPQFTHCLKEAVFTFPLIGCPLANTQVRTAGRWRWGGLGALQPGVPEHRGDVKDLSSHSKKII